MIGFTENIRFLSRIQMREYGQAFVAGLKGIDIVKSWPGPGQK